MVEGLDNNKFLAGQEHHPINSTLLRIPQNWISPCRSTTHLRTASSYEPCFCGRGPRISSSAPIALAQVANLYSLTILGNQSLSYASRCYESKVSARIG